MTPGHVPARSASRAEADARIHPLPFTHRLEVLRPSAVERIHDATLTVLERVGIEVRSAEMVTRLERAGAEADHETRRVRFPRAVVEEALTLPPRDLLFAARDPACDLVLDGANGYLAVDGNAAEILDHETDERRPSTKADLATITRVADALPEIGFQWQAVAARDTPLVAQPLHELHAQFTNTTKHLQLMTAALPQQAEGAVEIARIVAGGEAELRERPILSAFQTSLSPLTYDGPPLEAAAVYGEAGVPCGFVAMPISCATGPSTRAASIVQSNAEVLAGIVSLQLLVPGAPTFYGACGTVMDLRSGAAACGGPEDLLFQLASAQLARRYGVPSNIGTFATGAKSPDWQAGAENGLSALASWLGGAEMLCGAGLLYGARVYSAVELLLDAELFGLVRAMAEGFTIDDEDLGLEVIEEVGPGGHYLAQPHTLRNMRRLWQPRFFGREMWEDWEAAGKPEPRERARERLLRILEEHVPAPLPAGVEDRILEVIAEHERKAEGAD
jgi:trimethylamine--corrinoid protein Co-methyltransferase